MAVGELAGWIALVATCVAAIMTALNLGPRVTGWGFVVFTVGSIAWTTTGLTKGDTQLIAANVFLTIVNIVGIWRWLGREVKYHDSAETVARASVDAPVPTLVPAGRLLGQEMTGRDGSASAHVVDAMVCSTSGQIQTLLVRHGGGVGGIGERLVTLDSGQFELTADGVTSSLDDDALAKLPEATAA